MQRGALGGCYELGRRQGAEQDAGALSPGAPVISILQHRTPHDSQEEMLRRAVLAPHPLHPLCWLSTHTPAPLVWEESCWPPG